MPIKKAIFLDRDGVINKEKIHLFRVEDFEFIDGVFDACRCFISQGFLIVIITNQAGIAKGYYTESDYNILTDWMLERFIENGVYISGVYHCPHHPDFTGLCQCRKPAPGMILRAAGELGINLAESLLVGDKFSDVEAGRAAGIAGNFLITTGHRFDHDEAKHKGFMVINSLEELI